VTISALSPSGVPDLEIVTTSARVAENVRQLGFAEVPLASG